LILKRGSYQKCGLFLFLLRTNSLVIYGNNGFSFRYFYGPYSLSDNFLSFSYKFFINHRSIIKFFNLMNRIKLIFFALIFLAVACKNEQETNLVNRSIGNYESKKLNVYLTAQNTDSRLTLSQTSVFTNQRQPLETEYVVHVDPNKSFQEFLGVGGAITDAAAETFAKLTPNNQQKLIESYFNKDKGIGYSIIRTNIHSCDFSSNSYIYIEEGDSTLASFSIAHDTVYRIPLIKKAINESGGNAVLFASSWSPPAFMKSNNNMLHGGKLLSKFYQAWANYYVKFIKEYEKAGVPVWGITVQNEPMATQIWESCIYTAEEERDFLKNFLGPTFAKNGLTDKKIIVWDHNRDLMPYRASVIFSDPEAAKYAWGIGFHWYEDWSGGAQMFNNVRAVHEAWPDKNILFTEGCTESFRPDHYDYWPNAEDYGTSMIHDFNNGTVGWTDWNILLDEMGGPNHVKNFCFAPVHGDTQTGELIFTPAYYYIGHFSKFIHRGAHRIMSTPSRSALLCTSFLNPDGSIVTIVMNKSDQNIPYLLIVADGLAQLSIPAHAIQTIVY